MSEISARLQRIDRLCLQYDHFVGEVERLYTPAAGGSKNGDEGAEDASFGSGSRAAAGRGRPPMHARRYADDRRRELLADLAKDGIELRQLRGTIYQGPSGSRIGVPFATERQRNRWFLGLPHGEFDQALLLCEKDDRDVVTFSLNATFFAQYGALLSQVGGQLKLNVVRRGGDVFVLNVPNHGPVELSRMRDKFEDLR